MMGAGGLAQRAALDLVAAGVPRVVLQVPIDEVLLPAVEASACYGEGGDAGPGGVPGLEWARFDDERVAADVLMNDPGPTDAILVIDTERRTDVVSERTLERLSLARVRRGAAGHPVPAFFLCCRGRGRAERLRNFVVDEVVDATAVESSYLTAFVTVYFEVLPTYEAFTHADVSRRVRVAHGIASRLCHLDVWRPADLSFTKDGTAHGAGDLAADEIVRLDRRFPSRRGPLIGLVEFPPAGSDRADEVAVRVDIPVEDLPSAPPRPVDEGGSRLALGIPYL
jgi:hypothetical protein